jgi:Sulfotransferase family
MLISIDKRLAYLAMPKTGTTSVQAALARYCEVRFGDLPPRTRHSPRAKHMTMRAFERFMMPYLREIGAGDTETLCVIREPVDWLGSWYRFRSRPGFERTPKSTKGVSFAWFIEGYLAKPQPAYAKIGRMSGFVAGRSGKPAVTHMFRYDNLPEMVRFLEKRFGQEIELPKANVSPPADMQLPPALRARLETERAEDFELYARAT